MPKLGQQKKRRKLVQSFPGRGEREGNVSVTSVVTLEKPDRIGDKSQTSSRKGEWGNNIIGKGGRKRDWNSTPVPGFEAGPV